VVRARGGGKAGKGRDARRPRPPISRSPLSRGHGTGTTRSAGAPAVAGGRAAAACVHTDPVNGGAAYWGMQMQSGRGRVAVPDPDGWIHRSICTLRPALLLPCLHATGAGRCVGPDEIRSVCAGWDRPCQGEEGPAPIERGFLAVRRQSVRVRAKAKPAR